MNDAAVVVSVVVEVASVSLFGVSVRCGLSREGCQPAGCCRAVDAQPWLVRVRVASCCRVEAWGRSPRHVHPPCCLFGIAASLQPFPGPAPGSPGPVHAQSGLAGESRVGAWRGAVKKVPLFG